ncbi:MAG: solute carrier family 26 protein [Flavobacteriaceae bacterium]|jgi:SulP family sulfate permease|nr:solute carrier family 26 protein [Flavobacteriaceae bacterium]MBT6127480.1 solute carrier family 26 protein [Flavobacteriaceae bacterium]
MQRYFPFLEWIKNYDSDLFKGDLSAGITVAVMLIPQGMAYAMIAGLPPVYGLYAAIFPQMVYAFMGSSCHLAVGPVAMDSLLVATALNTIAVVDANHYISLAIFLALFMGLIQVFLGFLKFGFLVNFLSQPVISGFTSAAAVVIGMTQLKHVIGIDLPSHHLIQKIFHSLWQSNEEIHLFTLLITLGSIALIFAIKYLSHRIPAALIVVVASTLLTAQLSWNEKGLNIVGPIPEGLPSIQLQSISLEEVYQLLPMALTLALIAFLEAISVAKAIEIKEKKETINPNQELIALGTANILGSLFQSYPTTGGFSRTAVNHQSGAKTGIASLISATLVALTLMFFTDWFYHLPKAVLGAIILTAVINLIDLKYPYKLWKTHREEFFVLLFTFAVTLVMGIKEGILLGTLVALSLMIYRSSQPHIAVLGRIKGTSRFRNVLRFSEEIETFPGVLIIRFDGQLFFGNHTYFKKQIAKRLEEEKNKIQFLVIDAGPIHYIDASAYNTLENWVQDLQQKNIKVLWVKAIGPIRDIFYRDGLVKIVDKRNFFSNLDTAIKHIQGEEIPKIEKRISNQNNLK